MWLTRECDYAVVVLAFFGGRRRDSVVSCEEVADRLTMPYDFLAKILQKLCRATLITSRRGPHGGYSLARDPTAIRLIDVFRAVADPPLLVDCVEPGGCRCPRISLCEIVEPMQALHHKLEALLEGITIADLVTSSLFRDSLVAGHPSGGRQAAKRVSTG